MSIHNVALLTRVLQTVDTANGLLLPEAMERCDDCAPSAAHGYPRYLRHYGSP